MNLVALISVHNEERMIGACLDFLHAQGVRFFLLDDRCTDGTMDIVRRYAGRGLVGTDTLPDGRCFDLQRILQRKTELLRDLEADWFMHADADEFRTSTEPGETLAQAVARMDAAGFNAINFQEFTFVPTAEAPAHQPADFQQTMRWYYPFLPQPLHRLNAWKNLGQDIDLVRDAGHRVHFAGRRIYPQSLILRHYLYISRDHFLAKYRDRTHPEAARQRNWHGWREQADERRFYCPPQRVLRTFDPERPWNLDASHPRTRHLLEDAG